MMKQIKSNNWLDFFFLSKICVRLDQCKQCAGKIRETGLNCHTSSAQQ